MSHPQKADADYKGHTVIVHEPIRVKNGDSHVTVGPRYVIKDGRKFKICPITSVNKREFELFSEIHHVEKTAEKGKHIVYESDGKGYKRSKEKFD